MSARGKFPKFTGAAGTLIRRSNFLDGTQKTYFGPGQLPDCFSDSLTHYKHPTDWPTKGSLLKSPQQVLLSNSCYLGGGYLIDIFDVIGIFIQVKKTINKIRPKRTWVDIMDWNFAQPPIAGHGFDNPPVNNNPSPGAVYSLGMRFNYILTPNPADSFLGTDFLHFYCGGNSPYHLGQYLAPDTPFPVYGIFGPGAAASAGIRNDFSITNGQVWDTDLTMLAKSYPSMAGHNVYMYSINGGAADDPHYSDLLVPEIMEICTRLAPYGYTYGGDYTQVTVGNLVNLIAKHYNFDPGTGQDI